MNLVTCHFALIMQQLEKACTLGDLETIIHLKTRGFDIHINSYILLIWSSENGHLPIVRYLLENGADIHANNDWAVRLAAYNGHLPVVRYLVEHRANIHACDDWALKWSMTNKQIPVVKYLVSCDPGYYATYQPYIDYRQRCL